MAKLDVKSIDEQIKRLEQLKSFMSDPLTAQMVEQLIASKNGHSSDAPAPSQEKPKSSKGEFVSKIEEICRGFGDKQFVISDVIKAYANRGYLFAAKDKNVAVYSALQRLLGKSIEIAVKGSGRNPTKYRLIRRFPREITAVVKEG
ncbi:MAG: hypothetical protein ABSG77_04860 [Candidatus Acidiferrum sp.]|jgi:hypothetical protein